jgi:hypothetical protein
MMAGSHMTVVMVVLLVAMMDGIVAATVPAIARR